MQLLENTIREQLATCSSRKTGRGCGNWVKDLYVLNIDKASAIDPDATNTIHAIECVQMAAPVFNFRSKFRSSVVGGVYASAVLLVSKPQVAHRQRILGCFYTVIERMRSWIHDGLVSMIPRLRVFLESAVFSRTVYLGAILNAVAILYDHARIDICGYYAAFDLRI